MHNKAASILEKALKEKARGKFDKALRRLEDAMKRYPDEFELCIEAADISLQAGESVQAARYLQHAQKKFPSEKERISEYTLDKIKSTGDPVLGKYAMEQAIKRRKLDEAMDILDLLPDHSARQLLKRNRTKQQTLSSAARGDISLSGELLTHAISEGLMCLRLGRTQEAATTFLHIVDEQPLEAEMLEPFLAVLEQSESEPGRIRYTLACCNMTMGHDQTAANKMLAAVRSEPSLCDDAIKRLKSLPTKLTISEPIELALIEVLLLNGEIAEAGERVSQALDKEATRARWALGTLEPYVRNAEQDFNLHRAYMNAAVLAEEPRALLDSLKLLRKIPDRVPDLFEWLEDKSRDNLFPTEILSLHGEMAFDIGQAARGCEIMRAVAANSQPDIPVVVNILERHRNLDRCVEDLINELRNEGEDNSSFASEETGLGFEVFENQEFSLSSHQESEFDTEPGPGADSDVYDNNKIPSESQRSTAPPPEPKQHNESTGSSDPRAQPTSEAPPVAPQPAPDHDTKEETMSRAPETDTRGNSFEDQFSLFIDGELENEAVLKLVPIALDLGMLHKVEELLLFHPETPDEMVRQQLYRAEFHMHKDEVDCALVVLNSIDLEKTYVNDRKEAQLKMASCYARLNDYDAAHRVYVELVDAFPADRHIVDLAKQNYVRYLKGHCEEANTLEKVSSINH